MENILVKLILFSAITIVAVKSATTLPPIKIASCVRDGVTYAPGESFSPSPCEHCFCNGGMVACAIADCFGAPCADAVHDPKKCCPVCPNGENCKAPDGHIISKGDTYQLDKSTTCQCGSHGWGPALAMCAVTQTHSITDQVVS